MYIEIMNGLTGQGPRPMSTNRVVQGSLDRVRFDESGRSNLVDRTRYTFRLRSPAQVV